MEQYSANTGEPLLWHATSCGRDQETIQSIQSGGLRKSFYDSVRNMQAPGVYFMNLRRAAISHAEWSHSKARSQPVILGVPYPADSAAWDLDFEISQPAAFSFLRTYRDEVAAIPAGALRLRVTKANLPISYPDITPDEAHDVLCDLTLRAVRDDEQFLHLVFNDAVRNRPFGLHVRWQDNAVLGMPPRTNSFAALLEQAVHRLRDNDGARYRRFIADTLEASKTETQTRWGFKYTGDTPLFPVTTLKDPGWT